MKTQHLSRWLIAATFVMIMCAAAFTIVVYKQQDNVGKMFRNEVLPLYIPETVVDVVEAPIELDRRGEGGTILWQFNTEDPGEPCSTPALGDMDGDGTLEAVVASAGDAIYCLNPEDGSEFWDHPYTDDEISFLGETDATSGLDFNPPPIFSSVTVGDIDMGSEPEIIVGVKDNALCLRSDGDVHWLKGSTVGYYFSTCGVTDLEGEWTGVKDDLEVVMGSDDNAHPANGFLEAWHVDGQEIFRRQIETSGEGGLMGCSISCKDIDGSFEDEREPYEGEETDTELLCANHDRGLRIFERRGELPNGEAKYTQTIAVGTAQNAHQVYATNGIGNISGDMNCEILVGACLGFPRDWDGWGGRLICYDPQGNENWDFPLGQSGGCGIMSSPSIGDVQCAKNDPDEIELDYEIFFGSDNGKIYCVRAMESGGVEMWSYDTGGRVLSSPAICNIDGDDELEVVIGSDSGKVFCFDGDPSDGNDDGQSIPGDGISADLLWVADIGNPVGISSPVVADINLDGVLEVVIADALGSVWCIDAGGRCVRGQSDWPMFHYDLNKTGLYNPSTTFGVDLYPRKDYTTNPPTVESMIKDVEPGMSVTYNVTVKNIGRAFGAQAIDKIHLSIEGVPDGWRAFLDTPPHQGNPNPDYVMLKVDQQTNVTLKVTAPWEGDIGDLAQINITGNSSNDPWAYDEITTITMMNLFIDMDLAFTKEVDQDPTSEYEGYKWDKISPGADGVYALNIFNRGNTNDTYELQLSGIPEGWDAHFIDTGDFRTNVTLMSSIFEDMYTDPIQTTVNVKVECPLDATLGEEAWIKVTAVSMKSVFSTVEVLEKADELLLVAGSLTDVKLSCDEPQMFISPNASAEFELVIENLSNDQIDVVFSYDGLLDGWKVDLVDEVQLLIGQKRKVIVKLIAPADAPADLTCVMTVSGRIKDKSHLVSTVGLTAIVRHVYDFNVKVVPDQKSVDPGDDVTFNVQVRNFGNGKDVITPSPYDIILGWNVSFMLQGFRVSAIDLYYKGFANFSVTMTVPKETLAGSYMVGLNISGIDNTVIKYVEVVVNQTYNMKVLPFPYEANSEDPTKTEGTMDPGRIVPFMVEVRNEANGPDTVNLTIEGMGSGGDNWNAWFAAVSNTPDYTRNTKYIDFDEKLTISNYGSDINYLPNSSTVYRMTVHLPTKQKAWVMIYIQSPVDSLANTVKTISIKGDSTGAGKDDPTDNKASIDLTILYPDLTISDVIKISSPNGKPANGEITTISVNIRNVGDIEATNVIVVLKIDGKEAKRAVVKRVLVDKDQLITFSWKAESGKHKITIEIDPDGTVIETNDQNTGINNNVKTRDVTVGTPGADILQAEAVQTVLLPLFLLLLVAAAVGIATMIYLKKKSEM